MYAASDAMDFERAARLRDDVGALQKALEKQAVVLGDGADAVVIALAGADQHASSLLQQPDQFRREALAHRDQAAAGRATLNRRASNSTVTWPSAGTQPLASNNSGTMLLSLASRASMVSASVIRPGTSSEVATQTATSPSHSARTKYGLFIP